MLRGFPVCLKEILYVVTRVFAIEIDDTEEDVKYLTNNHDDDGEGGQSVGN